MGPDSITWQAGTTGQEFLSSEGPQVPRSGGCPTFRIAESPKAPPTWNLDSENWNQAGPPSDSGEKPSKRVNCSNSW